jgi:hypothetical protein
MKYIKQSDGTIASVVPEVEEALVAAGIKLLSATSPEVKAYFAELAEKSKVKQVTARQGHEALIRQGLYDNVVNAINGISDAKERQLAYNWFERSNSFNRDNATLLALTKTLGLTDNDVDNLFAFAATL